MSLNCVEIEQIVATFPQQGIFSHFFQDNESFFYITIYDGQNYSTIKICLKDQYNYLCLLSSKPNIPKKKQRFAQFLNSRYTGSRLLSIKQYHYSRLVVFTFQHHKTDYQLICRLWGNGSNLLVLDQNQLIIDCFRRYPNRSEWPDEIFQFPDIKENQKNQYSVRPDFSQNINEKVNHYYEEILTSQIFQVKKHKLFQI
ncbi:MAG: NFACT family protein [Spirochaetes bacterium]|nr:NFACT family protein [Spirochaetota bacterium]